MTDFEFTLAKKRLARELKILVIVQVIAFLIAASGRLPWLILPGVGIPNNPGWDLIQMFATFGWIVFIVVAFLGGYRLATVPLPSIKLRLYGISVLLLIVGVYFELLELLAITFFLFGYCTIPQFFIARWLANETKEDIIEPDWEEEERLL